jgi:biopolymer transport protein TolR
MVSAPLMTPGLVDLPSVGQARQQPDKVVEIVIDASEALRIRVDGKGDGERLQLRTLAARVRALQGGSSNTPVVISADRGVKYEAVVRVMDTLQRAGIQRVGLAVRTTGST